MNKKLEKAKHLIEKEKLDGWLLYDFHGSNPFARQFLEFSKSVHTTRRFFYWIPVHGEPIKIVHAIEPNILDHWPGEKRIYSSWSLLHQILEQIVSFKKRVAMEYSPLAEVPSVSVVDAGTVDLIRSFHAEVVSSKDFLLYFTAQLTDTQIQSHKRACKALIQIVEGAWDLIEKTLKTGLAITEREVQLFIENELISRQLITDSPCIIASGIHSADPHYSTPKEGSSLIRRGDWILIDLWAKEKEEGAVFGDITRVAVAADGPTSEQQIVFDAVRGAQVQAIELISTRFKNKQRIEGWEVDEAARNFIRKAGFESFFIHRTGHSIETRLHGSGTCMDNLEMHDTRPLLPKTCFSIEPGIYLPGEFGIRLETDLLIHEDDRVEVTAGEQTAIRCLQV